MKKHLWLAIGGIAILIAVATIAYLAVLTGRCPTCGGRGYLNNPIYCFACLGAGKVIIVRHAGYMGRIPIYQRSNPTTCPICNGAGFILSRPCPTCGGKMTSKWREYWKQQARQFFLSTWWSIRREYIEFYAD